jgi:uncharacterized protein (TIGR02145 family)
MKKIGKYLLFFFLPVCTLLISCEKEKEGIHTILNPWVTYGTLTDIDGNSYKTIQIGTRTWMVRNLKTTRYNDGSPIQVVTDPKLWNSLASPACCWQDNSPIYKTTYGVLYNWYAVNTKKLCPVGWHISSDSDWNELTSYLGGENLAGGKLKESGFSHWYSPNNGATDETHFRALPGGYKSSSDSLFHGLHESGYWWTSTANDDMALGRVMSTSNNYVQRGFYPISSGFSVRCIWNY